MRYLAARRTFNLGFEPESVVAAFNPKIRAPDYFILSVAVWRTQNQLRQREILNLQSSLKKKEKAKSAARKKYGKPSFFKGH
jgi:hypothetical protein